MGLKNHDAVITLLEEKLQHEDLEKAKKTLEKLEKILPQKHDVPTDVVAAAVHYVAQYGTMNVGINEIVRLFKVEEVARAGVMARIYAESLEQGRYLE